MANEKKLGQKKGFRPGVTKEKLMKELTDDDWKRIDEMKTFHGLTEGTMGYKIALHLDQLRRQLRKSKLLIEKRFINIDQLKNTIDNIKKQLLSKEITEKNEDGTIMTESEAKNKVDHCKFIIKGEIDSIALELAEIRGIVDHKDIKGDIVFSETEFEKFATKCHEDLRARGYDLFY